VDAKLKRNVFKQASVLKNEIFTNIFYKKQKMFIICDVHWKFVMCTGNKLRADYAQRWG
jgi:hypothetical protein